MFYAQQKLVISIKYSFHSWMQILNKPENFSEKFGLSIQESIDSVSV